MERKILFAFMILSMLLAACSAGSSTPTVAPTNLPATEDIAAPEIEEVEAPADSVAVDMEELTSTTWAWTSFTDPAQQTAVETPLSYTLTFMEDGNITVVADCNNAMGSYVIDGNSLTIEIGPMTMAACRPESRSDNFMNYLSSAAIYFFEDGNLYVDLIADGGTMAFSPAETLMADDGEGAVAGALIANPWGWVSFTSPVEQYQIDNPDNYVLTFNADGTLSVKADCNNASGSYSLDGSSVSIELGSMMIAACPSESRSDDFVRNLGSAAIYFFEDDSLYVDLMADGGTMEFSSASEMIAENGFPADLDAQLDAYLQSQVFTEGGYPEGAAPGLVLLVDTPQGRYLNAAGVSSLEDGTPMQVDDRLEIGSNSKSFTIVVLMQLQEEGLLSFDDLLSDWLPELAAQIPNGEQMTLRQLANHTAGIWDYGDPIIGEAAVNPDKLEIGYTPEELVQYAIDNGTPDFAPGEEGQWIYSNTGYILLGMVAEAASGQPLGELYQKRIFEPLGLESAVLISGVPQEGEITSQGYWWREDDGARLNTTNWNVSQGWAAGGIAMTAGELAHYGEALTSAGELLQQAGSLEEMVAFNQDALFVVGAPYGLGLMDLGDGYIGHEGQTAGFQSLWYTNPEEGITVVGLTNSAAYPAYSFLNVRNILHETGPMPFTPATLLPIADEEPAFVPSKWAWTGMVDPSGSETMDIDPGTEISLSKDGNATVKDEGCGAAFGTYTIPASYQIDLNIESTDAVTCTGDEPLVMLLGLLEATESWRFENGKWIIVLVDGTELYFVTAE